MNPGEASLAEVEGGQGLRDTPIWQRIIRILCLAASLFFLWTALFGYLPDIRQRAVFLAFGIVMVFMLTPITSRKGWLWRKSVILDLILIAGALVACTNAFIKYEWYLTHFVDTTPLDQFSAAFLLIMIFEATRRTVGIIFPSLMLILFLYTWFGHLIPGALGHQTMPLYTIWLQLYQTTEGIWGLVTGLMASMVAVFFVLAGVLLFTGGGQTFIDISLWLTGRIRGGPALVAVVASGLFGTISGAGMVNVATTGQFTIPLMKNLGYRSEFAGAVEAVASMGGLIMPPIMGVGAFIMAELTGIPYIRICLYAAVPALLFYFAVFVGVRWEALKMNLVPVPKEQIPSARSIFTYHKIAPLFVPIASLLYFLITGWSPGHAAAMACVFAIAIYLFSDFSIARMKDRVVVVVGALFQGGRSLSKMAPMLVCASCIILFIDLSGLALKMSVAVMGMAEASVFLSFVFTAMIAIILGMGLPPVASYLLAAAICVPALGMLGIEGIYAHMFTYYYAMLANITPPVCIAVYIGAGIAKANWGKTALVAMRLGIMAYIVPFIFVYRPELMLEGALPDILLTIFVTLIAIILITAGLWGFLVGRMTMLARLLLVAAGIAILFPQYWPIGIVLIGIAFATQWLISKRRPAQTVAL
ncbi:TRAP transporter permease [Chloroflexota bacterium]